MIYLDSSVLLEIYLRQARRPDALAVLASPSPKVSSWLLPVEVPIVLRRVLGGRPGQLAAALARFDKDVLAVTMGGRLDEVAVRARHDIRLASCRALDAIHVSCALSLREQSGHPVVVATFDARLADLAQRVGLGLAC